MRRRTKVAASYFTLLKRLEIETAFTRIEIWPITDIGETWRAPCCHAPPSPPQKNGLNIGVFFVMCEQSSKVYGISCGLCCLSHNVNEFSFLTERSRIFQWLLPPFIPRIQPHLRITQRLLRQRELFITARKHSLRRLCFYTCLSVILFMVVVVGVCAWQGGVHVDGGHACQGVGRWAYVAGGVCMVDGGHACQGGLHGGGTCMAGGIHGRGHVW